MIGKSIMNLKGVQLTDRDMEIMRFINDFGFCEMPQIEKRFDIKPQRSYRVIGRLIRVGLVKHERGFHRSYGAYYLTIQGAKCTELPAIEKISLGQYKHQIALINVYIKLRQEYPQANWISERQLKFEKFYDGIGKRGHIADGMLIFPDGKEVAIEVEMSVKGKSRIEKILKGYAAQFTIKEVWYYCSPNVISALTALSAKMPFIKINNLTDFLA
jgi:DNA-binding MarR family transcriptional regulator